jgi:hypothetical protein
MKVTTETALRRVKVLRLQKELGQLSGFDYNVRCLFALEEEVRSLQEQLKGRRQVITDLIR